MSKPEKLSKYELMKLAVDPVWKEFLSEFRDDQACLDDIKRRLSSASYLSCRECNSADLLRCLDDNRVYKCTKCKTLNWLTSGTFFEGLKRLHAWYGGIFLFDKGVEVSICYLHKLCGMVYSSTHDMVGCISVVIKQELKDPEHRVGSGHFMDNFLRRSKATPFFSHPSSEEEVFSTKLSGAAVHPFDVTTKTAIEAQEKSQAESPIEAAPTTSPRVAIPAEILKALDSEEIKIVESLSFVEKSFEELMQRLNLSAQLLLARLSLLELKEIVSISPGNQIRLHPRHSAVVSRRATKCGVDSCEECLTGSSIRNRSNTKSQYCSRFVQRFRIFIQDIQYGISRKYLQLNVTRLKFVLDARKRKNLEGASLFDLCLRHKRATRQEILDYVTPSVVVF